MLLKEISRRNGVRTKFFDLKVKNCSKYGMAKGKRKTERENATKNENIPQIKKTVSKIAT